MWKFTGIILAIVVMSAKGQNNTTIAVSETPASSATVSATPASSAIVAPSNSSSAAPPASSSVAIPTPTQPPTTKAVSETPASSTTVGASALASSASVAPSNSSSAAPPASSSVAIPTPTQPPTTKAAILTKTFKVELKTKVVGVSTEEANNYVNDPTSPAATKFKNGFCDAVKAKVFKDTGSTPECEVTKMTIGSIIVDYQLTVTADNKGEADKFVTAVEEAVKSGKVGNFSTDPSSFTSKITEVTTAPPTNKPEEKLTTTLFIILCVGLGILIIIIILLIIMIVYLAKMVKRARVNPKN